jgi:hypothetical protein
MKATKVSISKKDGLVRFSDEQSPFWLGGKQVESYYCFSQGVLGSLF